MRNVGFSSGAIAYGDFKSALKMLSATPFPCIELSALRVSELRGLIEALPVLDLSGYDYKSFHAPSNFTNEEELWVADLLYSAVPETWPIVLHPDSIFDFEIWKRFGGRLAIENMDRRKPIGRTAGELAKVYERLPGASLCFDVGHARQCDPSMTEAYLILSRFSERLVQVHISEVNSSSQHDPISYGAMLAFQQVAGMIPMRIPIIIESRVEAKKIANEASQVQAALRLLGIRAA